MISVAASRRHRVWRMFVRALALLSGGTLLLCLAWLVTNLVDDAPSARPPVLALPALPAAAQQEAFFYWVGLTHVATPSPAQTGRAQWQEEIAIAQALRAVPRPTAEQLPKLTERAFLPRLQGPPLHCPDDDDCAAYWRTGRTGRTGLTGRTQPEALAAQMAPHAALGERCAGAPEEFVELVPPPSLTGPFAAHASNAYQCML